jgi:hypothetical protein
MRPEGIALFLFVGGSILLAGVAVGLSAFFLVELSRFERVRRRQASPRSDFLERLLRGLAHNAIHDIGDVHDAYRAFFGVGVLRGSHLEEIAEFLQRTMRRIASAPHGSWDGWLHEHTQLLDELLASNQRALEMERICEPFSGTPEPERLLLKDLLELAVGEKAAVTAKLDALAKAIRFRQDRVERLGRENARSLRLARWGWYGTMGLSILSIILGIMSLGR